MTELLTFNSLIAFLALAALEIVLGVDNIVFIAILTEKLPRQWQAMARKLGLAVAALGRIILLFAITWVITLEHTTLLNVMDVEVTAKDVILILGGVFLIGKATWEIHESLEGSEAHTEHSAPNATTTKKTTATLGMVLGQIVLLDVVFSIDSVLTAVGMVKPDDYTSAAFPFTTVPWVPLLIMVVAVLAAIAVMLTFIDPIARFIKQHPTMKMLALSFLLLVGLLLMAEGFGQHVPRGYVYFAMGFSLFVELLNLRIRKKRHTPTVEQPPNA